MTYLKAVLEQLVFEPMLRHELRDLHIVATALGAEYDEGLVLSMDGTVASRRVPFDERALEDSRMSARSLAPLLAAALTTSVPP